ncbi:TIGR03915 family putative DNA repair protein [Mobilitalea sibirica]|uniref:TIGR03915 family putative DNA repair protein n=1 Tax=Mobilitalea sibirica TaxID=1462919 RepID=A0A8J7L286_9FIRM|nr:TIGR03915 family putative DNA repair protein [Mobilitalea sibirica]MBH1940118.1 TIGR03915 family putative DNA repair protein [Mobilitalea sibirica]
MSTIKIFLCENSIDGIFTAVYVAWSSGYGHSNVKIEEECEDHSYSNMELFSDYITVKTDYDLAMKVSRSIKNKISEEVYQIVCRVALSNHIGKADLIYRFLIRGFQIGSGIMEHLSEEVVSTVFKINRYVSYEAHHFLGFVRFSKQESGLLTSVIHPKNNVLSLISSHFADRLSNEKFVIYDENRKTASVHIPGRPWFIVQISDYNVNLFEDISCEEDEYQDLWKTFFDSIAIKERTNPKLQRNNLPLRFRGDMTEFKP